MYDGIEFRGFAQDDVEELAAKSGVPVWNGLTTEWHPTQMLADILTVQENFNYDIKGKTLVFMGDAANNVARSLMVVCSKLGMNFVPAARRRTCPDRRAREDLRGHRRPRTAAPEVHRRREGRLHRRRRIYTDVWVSMGEPDEVWAERIAQLTPYRVTSEVMAMANPGASSCTACPASTTPTPRLAPRSASSSASPSRRSPTRSSRAPASKVFDEAENRMHTIKAVMYATLK